VDWVKVVGFNDENNDPSDSIKGEQLLHNLSICYYSKIGFSFKNSVGKDEMQPSIGNTQIQLSRWKVGH
jgi:hypothetical protein